MPTAKTKKQIGKKTAEKKTSPFKDQALLEKEITSFVNKFKATVQNQAKRISDYFEMSCFNYIVEFYENKGYTISIENLQQGKYRYKCSTSGIQDNFSHFKIIKKVGQRNYEFEIHHNLAVQSSHNEEIFTTPDISIIKKGKVKTTIGFYETKTRFSHTLQPDLITFCEVKQFNPFPELLFSFIGVVNELRPEIIINKAKEIKPIHIAPSLMISGKPNKHTLKIKESLENRYHINVIYDIFYSGAATFSKDGIEALRTMSFLVK